MLPEDFAVEVMVVPTMMRMLVPLMVIVMMKMEMMLNKVCMISFMFSCVAC